MIIEFVGKFYDNHSLSIVNRNIALNLANISAVTLRIVALDNYDPKHNLNKEVVKKLKNLEKFPEGVINPDIQLRHTYPPIWQWPDSPNTKVVYIQPWEFPKAPFEWQYKFETFADGLIVPSNYVKNVFTNGGLSPNKVFVIPNGYDEAIYNKQPSEEPLPAAIQKDKFNFVYVGNTQWRKNLNTLLEVWSKTFRKYDNARLIIKDNPNIYGKTNIISELVRLQYKTNCAEIVYLDDDFSDKQMAAIYKASKIVVHPYRAEGFGMHIQEAVACGCTPIIPDKGPTEDFIPETVGFRIKTNPIAVNIEDSNIFATKPGDAMTLMGAHTFINEPNAADLQKLMLHVYSGHNKSQYRDPVLEYESPNTWSNVANSYYDALLAIHKKSFITRKVL